MSGLIIVYDFLSEAVVQEYLMRNAIYHLHKKIVSHSWPCNIWEKRVPVSWEEARMHGLIPRNVILISTKGSVDDIF